MAKTDTKNKAPKTDPKTGRDAKGHFAKGNLFSLGLQTSGVPPKYETPAAIAEKIAEYIDYEDSQKRPDNFSGQGKGIYTLTGCALYLGFASRQSMYDYEEKSPEFAYVLNRFRQFMVHWNEQKMYWAGTYMAAQFWLRNHGDYSEESSIKQQQTITLVQPVVKSTGLEFASNEADVKE